jgi:hypothetical protein
MIINNMKSIKYKGIMYKSMGAQHFILLYLYTFIPLY